MKPSWFVRSCEMKRVCVKSVNTEVVEGTSPPACRPWFGAIWLYKTKIFEHTRKLQTKQSCPPDTDPRTNVLQFIVIHSLSSNGWRLVWFICLVSKQHVTLPEQSLNFVQTLHKIRHCFRYLDMVVTSCHLKEFSPTSPLFLGRNLGSPVLGILLAHRYYRLHFEDG